MKHRRLGDLLLLEQVITEAQLQNAMGKQHETGQKLGKILIEQGLMTEEILLACLSRQLQIPYIDLKSYAVFPELIRKLSEVQARHYRALILKETEESFLIGMVDPLDIYAFDKLHKILARPLKLAVVSEAALFKIIDRVYRRQQEITELAGTLSEEMALTEGLSLVEEKEEGLDPTVVKLIHSIYQDAVQARASDIHIEPGKEGLRIRLRIDGVLHEHMLEDKQHIAQALIQHLKLKAHLNIAEKRMPQDGRFNITVHGKPFDVRMSTIPVVDGESVVMRLLDKSMRLMTLKELGVPEKISQTLQALIKRPYGMLLVTGPTGSGKTTTLYSILNELNSPQSKIITVEDPVEYRIERVNQIQVNYKIDLNFARVLRSILRQDPDIIMVGEIRDQETAEIAMRAAMTGHLVLATLHTNDAMTSALRLLDLVKEGYLVAAALSAVIAERLIRKLCLECSVEAQPHPQTEAWLAHAFPGCSGHFKEPRGCQHCNMTGYQGRIGVYELLLPTTPMLQALRNNDPAQFAAEACQNRSTESLGAAALELAMSGITSLSEVIKVTESIEDR